MPNLFSSREVVHVLERRGFVFASQKGSHAKYRKAMSGEVLTVIVPMGKREIPRGTFASVLRQAHLQERDFLS